MLFNSFSFALFMPVVYLLYWFVLNKQLRLQNILLLTASYFFYGCWDWRFLFLLFTSTLLDFIIGIKMEKHPSKRKNWLLLGLLFNLGFLGFFKYYNFFAGSLAGLLSVTGLQVHIQTLNIVLPVGISFYTFHELSYLFDLYRGKIKAEKNFVHYAVFVSFFPLLVAGPIERATHLLPQIKRERQFNYHLSVSGMRVILWGLFKKIMIADRLAVFVDKVYENAPAAEGMPALIACVFFAFQLYFDFSGYSDMALGLGRLLGFDLFVNFKRPYLSHSFGEFWQRWHISLSSWFRDYVYIPLGGNREGNSKTTRNVLIVFLLSGLWHGASWNFAAWGLLNALFLLRLDPLINRSASQHIFMKLIKACVVTACWTLSLVFFRADGFKAAFEMITHLGTSHSDRLMQFGLNTAELKLVVWLLVMVLLVEIISEKNEKKIPGLLNSLPAAVRWTGYIAMTLMIVFYGHYGNGNEHSFIYFQF